MLRFVAPSQPTRFCCGWPEFALIAMLMAGCQHAPIATPPAGPSGGGGFLPPMIAVHTPDLSPRLLDRRVDLNWLDLDGFFPPGARRVGPSQRVSFELMPDARTRFPSMELCTSPDKRFVLFHDGMKRKQNDIFHWLMLLKHDAPFPNAIFCTKLAFETSWSPDSLRFAVTHFIGDNSSEVFVVHTADLDRKPIEVKPFFEEHFPPQVASAPVFIKAYRWTRDGRLIVRAIGRAREEPYELFGCEVAVVFTGPDAEPRAMYLRGYIKPQDDR